MKHLYRAMYGKQTSWAVAADREKAIQKSIAYYAHKGQTVDVEKLKVAPYTYRGTPMCVADYHRDGDKLVLTLIVDDHDADMDALRFGMQEG